MHGDRKEYYGMRKIRVSSRPANESNTECFQTPNHHKRTLAKPRSIAFQRIHTISSVDRS
uniref:Uncharacterized protein n=1 Tax=Anopheles christyi TaxID=43041 RepID=A0A182JQ97_9DIPT